MHTAISLAPNGPGILPFRHRAFDQDSPSWDIHQRAALLGYEITGRDDSNTPTSVGAWKEDVNTRGDLNCANYWQADYTQRPVGCWAFGYPSVVQSQSSGASPGSAQYNGGSSATSSTGGSMQVLPLGMNANADQRFQPKSPLVAQPVGAAGSDPNAPGSSGNGGAGAGGANPFDPNNAGQDFIPSVPVGSLNNGGGPGYNGVLNPFGTGSTYNPAGGAGVGGLAPGQSIGVNFGNPLAGTGIGGLAPGQGFSGFSYGGPNGGSAASLSGLPGVGWSSGGGLGFTLVYPPGYNH